MQSGRTMCISTKIIPSRPARIYLFIENATLLRCDTFAFKLQLATLVQNNMLNMLTVEKEIHIHRSYEVENLHARFRIFARIISFSDPEPKVWSAREIVSSSEKKPANKCKEIAKHQIMLKNIRQCLIQVAQNSTT